MGEFQIDSAKISFVPDSRERSPTLIAALEMFASALFQVSYVWQDHPRELNDSVNRDFDTFLEH